MTQVQIDDSRHAEIAGRRVRVGHSDDGDSFSAGASAAFEAIAGFDATLILVFADGRYDHEQMMAGVTSVAPAGSEVVGCTTGGASASAAANDGVFVMAIGGGSISVATRRVDIASRHPHDAGEAAASVIWDIDDRGHTVVLLLTGGVAAVQDEIMGGARTTIGIGTPLVGGCVAGVEMGASALFHATSEATRIGPDQVIGIAISSVDPIGIGADGEWLTDGPAQPQGGGEVGDPHDAPLGSTSAAYRQAVSAVNGSPIGVLFFGDAKHRLEDRSDASVAACALDRCFAWSEDGSVAHDAGVVALAIG